MNKFLFITEKVFWIKKKLNKRNKKYLKMIMKIINLNCYR